MTERFAKVPEWLPVALRYAVREPGDCAPTFAVAAWVQLAMRADFRTWRARVIWPVLADGLGSTERSARRAVGMLRRVGAVTIEADGSALLHVDNPDTSGRLPGFSDTTVTTIDTSVNRTPPVPAGQRHNPRTPQIHVQSPLVAVVPSWGECAAPPWECGTDRDAREAALRALREEDDNRARMPDTTGTRREDAREERTGTE